MGPLVVWRSRDGERLLTQGWRSFNAAAVARANGTQKLS